MKNLWQSLQRNMRVSFLDTAQETVLQLGRGGRTLFLVFSALLVVSSAGLLYLLEQNLVVSTPAYGGSLDEGVIGSPRFINPILAISDADRDTVALVYSGLLRATPEGSYEPDLAKEYSVSPDGRTYTFVLRPDATFHDGSPVEADDVLYTVQKAQDPALKSPLRANWDGVQVSALDAHTVQFLLKQPYAPFIENLTVGILPKELWQGVSDEEFPFSNLNQEPVGSGPYMLRGVSRSSSGIPQVYTLHSFKNYALGQPYLDAVVFHFYSSENDLISALQRGDVDSGSGISPANLTQLNTSSIKTAPLNRVFGVFFNQNQSVVLRDKTARAALNSSIERQALVDQVLGGFGTPLTTPVPPTLLAPATGQASSSQDALISAARQSLLDAGWKEGPDGILQKTSGTGSKATTVPLTFDLATADVPELRAAAEYLRIVWGKVGARVNVKIFEQGDLAQNVIRPRKYDALLFGEVVGRELDLFAFWNSSQRNDPGLNIAGYANAVADKALTSLRTTDNKEERQQLLTTLVGELNKDIPAVFLYAPNFVYSIPNDISGVDLGFIETPSDRFLSIPQWHREQERVWPWFVRTTQ